MCVKRNDKVLYRSESISVLNMNEQCVFVWVCSGPLWTQLCCGDGRHSCLEQEVCRPEQQWLQPWPAPPYALSWLVCLCVSVCVSETEGNREGKNRESTPIHHLNIHWGGVYKPVTCFVSALRRLLILSLSLCSLSFCSFSPLISSECLTPLNQSSGKWPTYLSFFPTSASTQQHTRTQPTELSPPYLSSFLHLRLLFLLISHLSTSCLPFITPPYCSFILLRLSIWLSHFSSSVRTGDKNTGMKVDLTEAGEQLNTVYSDMSRQTDISLKGC